VDILARELASIHARWAPVEVRAAAILSNIRLSCRDLLQGESYNQANERHVEDFIARLREEFPGRTYEVERGGRQDPPRSFPAVGTTRATGATRRVW
jgi:hypothetical protein